MAVSPQPAETGDPQPPRKWRPKLVRRAGFLLIAIAVGVIAADFVPKEIARWLFAAAINAHEEAVNARRERNVALADEKANLAQQRISRAITFDARNPRIFLQRAQWRLEQEMYAAALEDCDRAIELAPESLPIYRLRAVINLELNEWDKVLADAKRIVELAEGKGDANLWEPLNELAYFRALANRDLDAAEKDANRAIALLEKQINETTQAPRDPAHAIYRAMLYDTRGYVHFRQGRYQQALADYHTAIRSLGRARELWSTWERSVPETLAANHRPWFQSSVHQCLITYAHRAMAYEALGQIRNARRDLELAQLQGLDVFREKESAAIANRVLAPPQN